MAINFPGPYELRIFYTSPDITPGGSLEHEQRLNIDIDTPPSPGAEFSSMDVVSPGSISLPTLDEVVEDYLTVLAGLHDDETTFERVELWHYPVEQSFESNFVSTYQPTVDTGTSTFPAVAASQQILTFRTTEGGIMKVSVMEGVVGPGRRTTYAAAITEVKALFDFVLSGGSGYEAVFLGRDTSYPFAPIAFFPGQNEALFKRRYR